MRRFTGRFGLLALVTALGLLLSACGGAKSTAPAPAPTTPAAAPVAAPTPVAAPAPQVSDDLIIVALPVRGSANLTDEEKPLRSCIPQTRFMRNEKITWLIKVIDPKTGKPMSDEELGAVETVVGGGEVIAAKWGPRPSKQPTDHYWANGWIIPENYPTGKLEWTITATAKDGRKGVLHYFNSSSVHLTILDGVVPTIKPPAKS